MSALTAKQVSVQLKAIPDWSKRMQTLHRTYQLADFLKGIDFVNQIARQAQINNHHPDIDIRYDKVTLTLTTHDERGITEKDFALARQSDEIYVKFFVK